MSGLDLRTSKISPRFSVGQFMMIKSFPGKITKESPERVKGKSSVTWVEAHGKSAGTMTTGLSLCLHLGPALPLPSALPPAPPTTVWAITIYHSDNFSSRGLRKSSEGRGGARGQEQVAIGGSLASTNLNLLPMVFLHLPLCSPQFS